MSAKKITGRRLGLEAFRARSDLLGALSQARQREREVSWAKALAQRGSKRQVSMVFLAALLIDIGACAGFMALAAAKALVALPFALVMVPGLLFGAKWRGKVKRFFLSVVGLLFEIKSFLGLAFRQATGTWRMWEAMAACGPALADALARRPGLAAQGWIWTALGLNPFVIAGLGKGKHELAWANEGLCEYRPWWSRNHAGYVLLTSPEMMAAAFRPLGLLGALRRRVAPWRSPWEDLLGQAKGACLWEASPVSSTELSAWARAAWVRREKELLGAEVDASQALSLPARARRRL